MRQIFCVSLFPFSFYYRLTVKHFQDQKPWTDAFLNESMHHEAADFMKHETKLTIPTTKYLDLSYACFMSILFRQLIIFWALIFPNIHYPRDFSTIYLQNMTACVLPQNKLFSNERGTRRNLFLPTENILSKIFS